MTLPMKERAAPSTITGYHAHVYYDGPAARDHAGWMRERLQALFEVRMGRWRDFLVGPHPTPMYQVAFAPDQFERIVPWLALNHGELSILIHPETGNDVADHSDHALWIGKQMDLFLENLPGFEEEDVDQPA